MDVYGIAPASSIPPAIYTIDDSIVFNVSMPADVGDSSPTFNWNYISVPFPSGGNHTLVITSDIANSFYIDYILVTSDTAFVPPLKATEKGAGIPATSSPTSETISYKSTTATPSLLSSNPSNNRSKSGVIIGSVVSTVTFVLLLVLVMFFLRHRRRTKSYHLGCQSVHEAGSPPRTSHLYSSL